MLLILGRLDQMPKRLVVEMEKRRGKDRVEQRMVTHIPLPFPYESLLHAVAYRHHAADVASAYLLHHRQHHHRLVRRSLALAPVDIQPPKHLHIFHQHRHTQIPLLVHPLAKLRINLPTVRKATGAEQSSAPVYIEYLSCYAAS